MDKVKELYETTSYTLEEIAKLTNETYWHVWKYVKENYSLGQRKERKVKNYARSKEGIKNPQYGTHRNFGPVEDGKGYLMVLKPEWYTGRKGTRHVFQHQVVMCEALGLTEMPRGFCVHHIDGDKKNNDLINLAMLTTSAHMRLHQREGATTRAKARRVQEDSKRPTSSKVNDE